MCWRLCEALLEAMLRSVGLSFAEMHLGFYCYSKCRKSCNRPAIEAATFQFNRV